MYSLNLLPPQIKQEINFSKKNAKIIKYLTTSLSVLVITLSLFVGLALAIYNEKNIAELEKTSARESIELKKEVQEKANDFSDRLSLIKKLKAARTDWNAILAALAENTPTGIQIESVTFTTKEKTRAKISGFARSDQDVALFKDLLAEAEYFSYVDIESVSESGKPAAGGGSSKSFSISLSLVTGKK